MVIEVDYPRVPAAPGLHCREGSTERHIMTKIYFPSIDAEAEVSADIKRGATAAVCDAFKSGAYFGRVRHVKFTVRRPANWDRKDETFVLHQIPVGGFAYKVEA